MAASQTGLDFLRKRTIVDCDTLDEEGDDFSSLLVSIHDLDIAKN